MNTGYLAWTRGRPIIALKRTLACGQGEKMSTTESAPAIPAFKYIEFDTTSFVARITLKHPPYNVLSVPLMHEMASAIEGLNGRGETKVIVLDSALKTFSAGIGIEDSKADRVFQTLEAFNRVFDAIREISKPLIVVVNGPAIGAGSELVAFGDMVIATPKAKFAQPEVKLGVFPPFASVMLPQLIGPKKTYEMILTGEAMTADEALALGFVNRLVPEAELAATVERILSKVGEFSAPVLEMTKKVIGGCIGLPLKQAMKTSQSLYLNELMDLEDVQEGLRAVLERRKPVWRNK
jgi:cyclohexa-1,5-dienecarbonyl-CoA hydratase